MGYNNNNAGMSFMRYRHYGQYDDLAYYDMLAMKQTEEKEAPVNTTTKTSNTAKTQKNGNANELKTQNKNNRTGSQKSNAEDMRLLNVNHIDMAIQVQINICVLALEKKIDLYNIVQTCEYDCSRDAFMKGAVSPYSLNLDRPLAFLSLLSERMECRLQDFFMDKNRCKKKLGEVLEDILSSPMKFSAYALSLADFSHDEEDEREIEGIETYRMELNEVSILNSPLSFKRRDSHLTRIYIYRYSDEKTGEIYGYEMTMEKGGIEWTLPDHCLYKFMYDGYTVHEEKEGFLSHFFETMLTKYKEAGGIVSDYLA